ncbi:MAG: Gldg family protein [Gammaproteobacteria bacterium]|nr:Gldg family protein [Gammaproteobacteria bacterium]
MSKRLLSVTGLILAVVLLVALNIYSNATLRSARVDLTEGRMFTLSDGTRKVLGSLEEPITLRLYLSKQLATKLPSVSSYASRVEDLLEEFVRQSNGRITLLEVDPEPFSEEEDRAVAFGLSGIPIEGGAETFYFGLVGTGSTDEEEVIPYLSPAREQFLEYDVARLVQSLATTKLPTVGLLSDLQLDGGGPQAMMRGFGSEPFAIMEQIRQLFTVLPLDEAIDRIPEEVDVLLLVHPKRLSDKIQYAIDQFVMRGGRALVFVDPFSAVDQGQNAQQPGMSALLGNTSNPAKLLQSWGVQMDDSKLVGDLTYAARVRVPRDGRFVDMDYPLWLNLTGEAVNHDDITTSELNNVTLATPGFLTRVEAAGTTVTPLLQTSDKASLFGKMVVAQGADPQDVNRTYQPGGEVRMLAARITGKARSAFPDGPPPAASDAEQKKDDGAAADKQGADTQKPPHLAESEGDINVIVVADTDMLEDRFWVQVQEILGSRLAIPTAGNGSFVINALDNLAGGGELISVRSRGNYIRPFERINELRRDAELQFRDKEKQLVEQLQETEQRLVELQGQKPGEEALILSSAQREELARFQQQRLQIRKELRDVQLALRRSIDALEDRLKFINIALVPILIGVGGLIVGLIRMQRRSAAARRPAAA